MSKETEKFELTNLPVKITCLPIPILLPLFDFTTWLVRNTPEEYKTPLIHLLNVKMDFYKALNSLITIQIKKIEELKREIEKPPKKEKVKVE